LNSLRVLCFESPKVKRAALVAFPFLQLVPAVTSRPPSRSTPPRPRDAGLFGFHHRLLTCCLVRFHARLSTPLCRARQRRAPCAAFDFRLRRILSKSRPLPKLKRPGIRRRPQAGNVRKETCPFPWPSAVLCAAKGNAVASLHCRYSGLERGAAVRVPECHGINRALALVAGFQSRESGKRSITVLARAAPFSKGAGAWLLARCRLQLSHERRVLISAGA
jgi:hypothetical protein